MSFARKAVSFNLANAHQRELLEWIATQSGKNFSGFVKSVLYAHMKGGSGGGGVTVAMAPATAEWGGEADENAMNDIF